MAAPTDWFEDDDFWRLLGPSMFPPKKLEQAKVEVEDIIALLSLQPGASVLDLPCGWGRHAIEFAKRGFQVTAVDRTREYVNRARESAREANVSSIEFHQADMRHFSRPESFDLALCMFTSIGYFDTRDEERAALSNYHRNLKPGGTLIMELLGKEGLARQFRPRWWTDDNGVLVLAEVELLDAWTKVRNKWTLITGTERRTFEFTHWLYSAAELRQLLADAGFVSCEFYTDLKKTPYDHNAHRMTCIARKAG
jgi:ubiquinone/menaquinone biosynthesis C-methylase UbiE